jgi:hypothetical protein
MADARLEIKAGLVSFTGEGTETWLAEQLDKVLTKLIDLRELSKEIPEPDNGGITDDAEQGKAKKGSKVTLAPLAAYLKEKKATTNQSRKFLATAAWLQLGGMDPITTAEVTTNLNTHKQGKLSNPGQCLIHNVRSGNIVKSGKRQFYVADKGFEELGK